MKVRNMEQRYWLTACHWFGCCQCETPSRDDTARLSVLWVRQRALPYLPTHKSPQRHAQVRNFFTHHNANICGYILVLIMSSNWTTWKSSLYVLRVTSNTRSRRASGSEYFPPWHQQETAVDYWSIWRHSQRMNLVRLRDISAESIGSTSESEETCLWLTLRVAVNISSSSWITWFIIPMIKTEYKRGYDNRGGTYTQRAEPSESKASIICSNENPLWVLDHRYFLAVLAMIDILLESTGACLSISRTEANSTIIIGCGRRFHAAIQFQINVHICNFMQSEHIKRYFSYTFSSVRGWRYA